MKHRSERRGKFTIVSNTILHDKNVSLKAKALHTIMMSLPDDWEYSAWGLASFCNETVYTIRRLLSELKETGYLRIARVKQDSSNHGRIAYTYEIYEKPISQEPLSENQETVNEAVCPPLSELPLTADYTQINTNIQNTYIQNKDLQSTDYKERQSIHSEIEEMFMRSYRT